MSLSRDAAGYCVPTQIPPRRIFDVGTRMCGGLMHRVLLLGAGKIGRMIARFLMDSGDYELLVGDVSKSALDRIAKLTGAKTRVIDASYPVALGSAMKGYNTVLSALSYYHNPTVARPA